MSSARPPHVVILVENLPVPLDRRVWLEATTLVRAGYEVTVIGPRGKGEMRRLRERREGIRILRYPQRAATGLSGYLIEYLPSMAFTLAWLLALRATRPVNIVHGCNPPDLFFIAGRICRMWGAAYVFDQHDANPELAQTKWPRGWLGRRLVGLTTWLERQSYRAADVVLVPNDSYALLAKERGGLAGNRVVVVRNAPPGASFRRPVKAASAPPGRFRIGYLGVMGSQDGVELLIDAVAAMVRQAPDLDVQVDLVGDGEARPSLEARAAAAGVADRAVFHGYQQAAEFVPLLAAADVCVSPDPPTPFNHVSTMTKVVEYLAMGRPVVSFDLQETRRLIGSAGVIVEDPTSEGLAAALAELARNRPALEVMERAAANRIEELGLTWEESARRLLDAYASVAPLQAASTPHSTTA